MRRQKRERIQAINKIAHDQQVILKTDTAFHITEAYKATRTNIMFALAHQRCKKIMVTSSFPGEGKTTTCINLALTFADTGAKVLLIDADMRKPTVHQKLARINGKGLSHLISDFCTLEEAIQKKVKGTLDIITAGHIPPNPAELLASDKMGSLLDSLEDQYEYIFIDTPTLNVVTDATVLSHKVSGAIVVVRQEVTQHRDLQEALGKLNFVEAKILGLILNDITMSKNKRYGKYGRYSQYGYSLKEDI